MDLPQLNKQFPKQIPKRELLPLPEQKLPGLICTDPASENKLSDPCYNPAGLIHLTAISVQAVEGAPVLASVSGTVYSIEEDPQTGTTVTMEIGSGYQAVYGQLKDLTVEEGDIVTKGSVIGYVGTPTKYYSKEGSNLYFAMKKNGEPVDPIAYLP